MWFLNFQFIYAACVDGVQGDISVPECRIRDQIGLIGVISDTYLSVLGMFRLLPTTYFEVEGWLLSTLLLSI